MPSMLSASRRVVGVMADCHSTEIMQAGITCWGR